MTRTATKQESTALAQPFGTWTPKAAEQESAANDAANQGDYWKFAEGLNYFFLLPPLMSAIAKGLKSPFVIVWEHFYRDPEDTDRIIKHVCPSHQSGGDKPCESCDNADALQQSRSKADEKRGFDMRAKRVAYANIIPAVKDPDSGILLDPNVRICTMNPRKKSDGPYELLLKLMKDDGQNPCDPDNMLMICMKKKTNPSDSRDVKYDLIRAKFDRMPMTAIGNLNYPPQKWAAMAHDLTQKTKIPTSAEIRALISGDEEDDDDEPSHRAPRQKRGGSAQDVIDEGSNSDDDE